MNRRAALIVLTAALLPGLDASAAPPPSEVRDEVSQLLAALRSSGCQFFRNGTWHEAGEARAHLQRKYDYLAKRGLISTTEDFIERAATRSSVSGERYRVRCATQDAVDGARWLNEALARQRAARN